MRDLILHAHIFINLELSLIPDTYNWMALVIFAKDKIILHGDSCKVLDKVCLKLFFFLIFHLAIYF